MTGWFEEQIEKRRIEDEEVLVRACTGMAGIVMGSSIRNALNDSIEQAKNAIDLILKYYGIRLKEFPEGDEEFETRLDKMLHPFGIMKRTVILKEKWYADAVGPMLGFLMDSGVPVALIPDKSDGYIIDDGSRRTKVNRAVSETLMEEAFCFYRPFPLKKMGVKELFDYIIRCFSFQDVSRAAVVTLVATIIGTMIPRFTYWLFSDELIKSESVGSLFALGVFMVAVSVSSIMINALKNLITVRVQRKTLLFVEAASMMRVLSLPAGFFRKFSAGEISQRMSYISSLSNTMCNMIVSSVITSVFSVAYLTQIAGFAPGMVVPSILIITFNLMFSCISTLVQIGVSKETMKASSKESGMTYSLISGIQKIKLSGAEIRAFGKWSSAYSEAAKLTYDPPMFIKINPVIGTAITLFGTVILYYYALKTGLSVAEYSAFNAAYGMLFGALSTLFSIALSVADILPGLQMVEPIFSEVPEINGTKETLNRLSGGIEVSHVSFRYGEDTPLILNDISFKIRSGQYVAIVGKTGCGKSTLLRLLLGFETPLKGAVYYDGRDLKNLDLQSLRRLMGTVLQNGKLINGSIYENIAIQEPSLTLDAAWDAVEMAGIASDIREMPMGMQTIISEGGGGISGGQKQRLLIARAVASKPKILLFDEATSALDNKTQKQVSEALDSLKCTRIIIAHRLSTIRNADRILLLEDGKISADGTYDELLETNEFFKELVKRQST